MEIGGVTNCASKSQFMMNYTFTFIYYPLVGLEMMIDLQKKDISAELWNICELCQERISWKSVSPHSVSLKHGIRYLEKNHPFLHAMLTEKGIILVNTGSINHIVKYLLVECKIIVIKYNGIQRIHGAESFRVD